MQYIGGMFGLAYVFIPRVFSSLQSELDRALAAFKRGGEDDFPRDKLAFDDITECLQRLHRSSICCKPNGSAMGLDFEVSYFLDLAKLNEHLRACQLDR